MSCSSGPKNSCAKLGLIFLSAEYWFIGKRVGLWASCTFGLAAQDLTLWSFITMMNGISLICLDIVHSHRDDEMEGRKEAQVFKGDVSPTALWGRRRQSQLGTHSSSTVSFFGGGKQTARPWEKGKNLPGTRRRCAVCCKSRNHWCRLNWVCGLGTTCEDCEQRESCL